MADSSLVMPGADEAYRHSRNRLRAMEIDLRDRIEAVASARRQLPPGPVVPDYTFIENGSIVRLSELFASGKAHLILYHLMYWASDDSFCPSCSMWIDGFNAVAPHVTQHAKGNPDSTIAVFVKDSDCVRHVYTAHPTLENRGQGIDLLTPAYALLDLIPAGRGDWDPSNEAFDASLRAR